MSAKCRQYLIKIDEIKWSNSKLNVPIVVHKPFDIGVEDMCPWNLNALIEANTESRIFGYSYGVKKYGFYKNPPLLKALRPYTLEVLNTKK